MKNLNSDISVLSKISFPESSLEYYFSKKNRTAVRKYGNTNAIGGQFAQQFQILDFGSARVPVSGTVEISIATGKENEIISTDIPVVACFLMTCTKGTDDFYKVTWSCSMS